MATEYQQLLRAAAAASSEPQPDVAKVRATLVEAVKLEPNNPLAHHMIAAVRARENDHAGSSMAFLMASQHYPAGSLEWAETTSAAFVRLTRKECADVPKPAWWSDAALLALSHKVLEAAPQSCGAWQMRAMVLGGFEDSWQAAPRDAAQMDEASKAWQQTARRSDAADEKSRCVANGVLCAKYAQGRGGEP